MKAGIAEIAIEGPLAEKIHKSRMITKLGIGGLASLGAIVAALGLMPVTVGVSGIAAAPVAALSGLEIATVIAVATMGLGLLIALFKDYEEIEFSTTPPKLKLRKKSKP